MSNLNLELRLGAKGQRVKVDTPECCQNLMCFMPTVTSLSALKGLLFTTKIFSLCPLYRWKNKVVLK